MTSDGNFGPLLRGWRKRRRFSQLDLAAEADVSSRHLSFVETGRSRPSRELVLRLAGALDIPLRERNVLLQAAGYAPVYGEVSYEALAMASVRDAVEQVLTGHEPFPAIVVDRYWDLVAANGPAIALLSEGVARFLLEPPVNVLRVGLHPEGMASRIVNFGEWRAHLLGRLRRQVAATLDPRLMRLEDELRSHASGEAADVAVLAASDLAVPLVLRYGTKTLSFISTVASFGTPLDVTVSELIIESFFPADPATRAVLAAALTKATDGAMTPTS